MSEYYYLAASLPYLKFGEDLPITTEEFLYECEKWATEEDMKAITFALSDDVSESKEGPSVLGEWKRFDRENKEKIAEVRKAKKEKGTVKPPHEIKKIFEEGDPLLAERALEEKRWNFLDSLQASFQFDINWLVLYALKQKIGERLRVFNKDKGENIFYNLCEVIYEQSKG